MTVDDVKPLSEEELAEVDAYVKSIVYACWYRVEDREECASDAGRWRKKGYRVQIVDHGDYLYLRVRTTQEANHD